MEHQSQPSDFDHDRILIFTKAPKMIYLGHISSACVLIYLAVQSPQVPTWFIYVWSFIELIITPFLLGWLARSYNKNTDLWKKRKKLWLNCINALFLFIGLSWGTMLFVSLNPENAPYFSMQMAIAAGASAASVKSLGLLPNALKLYIVSFLGLLSVRLMFLGGDYILLGLLVIVFMAMLTGLSKDVFLAVNEYIKIKQQNLELVDKYKDSAMRANNANREKTRLLTAASHDMRQPIHAAALHLESLSAEGLSNEDWVTVGKVKQSLASLDRMFNSVLDVSLLDSGKISVSNSDVSLRKIVSSIVDEFQNMAEAAGTCIETNIPDVVISCDPVLFRRMIQNLISNAIRYGAASKITVYATDEGGSIRISVKDMGPGIHPKDQSIIFEDFSRLDQEDGGNLSNATSGQEKGMGLGLAIVRRLAALQGMSLSLTSNQSGESLQSGSGTIISLARIPIAASPLRNLADS